MKRLKTGIHIFLLLPIFLFAINLNAQGFGQNKAIYKNFDFRVYETGHFDLYTYLKNDTVRKWYLNKAESWFLKHKQIFVGDTFPQRIPLILYANHADFQQTTAISGEIGVGTGGVTEGLKTRVVLPLRPSLGQTEHVLGHELVHAFQYNHIKTSPYLSFRNMMYVPLWATEGMAEYLSLGRVDAHTAMWMRDAVLHGFFPRYKDMYKPKYFPYRYGQNFWAFFGGTYGDDQIVRLYDGMLQTGPEHAMDSIYGIKIDTFFQRWKTANELYYKQFLKGRDTVAKGRMLFSDKNAGRINISPSISPDGKKMIFLSEKQIISLDLYLADLHTGKMKVIGSRTVNNHIDAIDAYESAGTWSPDGKYFVFTVFKQGKTQLAVVNIAKRRVVKTWKVKGLESFSNPKWSPDGKNILLVGQQNGQTDLFLYNVASKKVKQITNDLYAELMPSWSADGKKIVFSTDYYYIKHDIYPSHYHLGILDIRTGTKTYPGVFPGADNLNPLFSLDGQSIYFLSDREGFRDLYRYDLTGGKIYQLTRFFTGISGITQFSPAIDINPSNGHIIYNYFDKHGYQIASADPGKLQAVEVQPNDVHREAAVLPPNIDFVRAMARLRKGQRPKYGLVDALLRTRFDSLNIVIKEKPYKPHFKLDYISNQGFGMTTSIYGTGFQGGVNMIFSDILGKNTLMTALSMNGELYDFGAMGLYINQGKKRQVGVYLSHIPYPNYMYGYDFENHNGQDYYIEKLYIIRLFEDKIGLFRTWPFSRTQRLEAGGSFARYYYRIDSYNYFYPYDSVSNSVYPQVVHFERRKERSPKGFNLGEINGAYVTDNSVFGMTAPMKGMRSRIGLQRYFGLLNFYTGTADFRYYLYRAPVTFAVRLMHINRFGKYVNQSRFLYPMFITYDYFIRGFNYNVLSEYAQRYNPSLSLNDLYGNKIFVSNFEVRLPFTGPERLALIKSSVLFSDLSLFLDAGWAWNAGEKPVFGIPQHPGERQLWASTGIALRINLFGQLIIQPYLSTPISLKNYHRWSFGLSFYPGF